MSEKKTKLLPMTKKNGLKRQLKLFGQNTMTVFVEKIEVLLKALGRSF